MSKCEDKAQRLGPLEMVSVSNVHGQPPIRETTQGNEKVNRMRLDHEKLMSGWIFPYSHSKEVLYYQSSGKTI